MDESTLEKYRRPLRIALGIMLVFVTLGAIVQFQLRGFEALPEIVVSVYLVALVVYGVSQDAMRTRRFRIALYVGVLAWGAVSYLEGRHDVVTYALVVLGAVLLTRELTFAG